MRFSQEFHEISGYFHSNILSRISGFVLVFSNTFFEVFTLVFAFAYFLSETYFQLYIHLHSKKAQINISAASMNISNMLNKINITIRKYKRTNLPNETIERGLMLLRSEFFNKLLTYVSDSTSCEDLLNILDLMSWILFNHFSLDSKTLKDLFAIFKEHLKKFLLVFYLHGNRSTSRKATLLLNFFLSKHVDRERVFGALLLQNLLELLKLLPFFESSASMNWFFILIHRVMAIDTNKTYENCMQMLTTLSKGETLLFVDCTSGFSFF